MSTTRSIGRLSEIAQVMVRHGFGYFFEAHKLSDLLPGRSAEDRIAHAAAEHAAASSARGQHLREVLDELGPTFVKFGQLLSTRPDVVPPDIIVELQKLQDDVTPFAMEDLERVVAEELGLERPGAPRDAPERRGRGRQGAAAIGTASDRIRSQADGLRRQARSGARAA